VEEALKERMMAEREKRRDGAREIDKPDPL